MRDFVPVLGYWNISELCQDKISGILYSDGRFLKN
jgi:hypothetical protein